MYREDCIFIIYLYLPENHYQCSVAAPNAHVASKHQRHIRDATIHFHCWHMNYFIKSNLNVP